MTSEATTSKEKLEAINWDNVDPTGKSKEASFFGNSNGDEEGTEAEEMLNADEPIVEEDEIIEDEETETDDNEEELDELSEEEVEALDDDEKEEYETKLEVKKEKEKLAKEKADKVKKDKEKKSKETTTKKPKEIVPGQEEDTDTTPKELYAALVDELKENGNLEFVDIPKKKTLSRKEFFDLQSKNDDARLDANLKEMFEGLDETAISFVKFIKDGGKTEDFISTFVNDTIPELNIDDPKLHDDFLEYYYTQIDGQTTEEAKETIETLDEAADKTKKERTAKRLYKKVKEIEAERKQQLLENTAKQQKKAIKEAQEFAIKLKSVTDSGEVLGVPLNGDDKKTLGDYITKPTKTLNGRKVPQWQYDLNEALKDEKKLVVLAKLLKSKFDLGFIKTKAKTETSNQVRRSLENLQKGGKGTQSVATSTRKSLADYFPN